MWEKFRLRVDLLWTARASYRLIVFVVLLFLSSLSWKFLVNIRTTNMPRQHGLSCNVSYSLNISIIFFISLTTQPMRHLWSPRRSEDRWAIFSPFVFQSSSSLSLGDTEVFLSASPCTLTASWWPGSVPAASTAMLPASSRAGRAALGWFGWLVGYPVPG